MAASTSAIGILILALAVAYVYSGQVVMMDKYRYNYRTWPKLNGESVDTAVAVIHEEFPHFKIQVRQAKNGIVSTILPNVVFLYEDDDGIVRNNPETVEQIPIEVTIWPEVVGLSLDEAKSVISRERPDAEIHTIHLETLRTGDVDLNRVRIFVDSNDVVVDTPRSG